MSDIWWIILGHLQYYDLLQVRQTCRALKYTSDHLTNNTQSAEEVLNQEPQIDPEQFHFGQAYRYGIWLYSRRDMVLARKFPRLPIQMILYNPYFNYTDMYDRYISSLCIIGGCLQTMPVFSNIRQLQLEYCHSNISMQDLLCQTKCEQYQFRQVIFPNDDFSGLIVLRDRKGPLQFDTIVYEGCSSLRYSVTCKTLYLRGTLHEDSLIVDDSVLAQFPNLQTLFLCTCDLRAKMSWTTVKSLECRNSTITDTRISTVFPHAQILLLTKDNRLALDLERLEQEFTQLCMLQFIDSDSHIIQWNKDRIQRVCSHAVLHHITRHLDYSDVSQLASTCNTWRFHLSLLETNPLALRPYTASKDCSALINNKQYIPRIYGNNVPFTVITSARTHREDYLCLYKMLDRVVIQSLFLKERPCLPLKHLVVERLELHNIVTDEMSDILHAVSPWVITAHQCVLSSTVYLMMMRRGIRELEFHHCILSNRRRQILRLYKRSGSTVEIDNSQRVPLRSWVFLIQELWVERLILRHCNLVSVPDLPRLKQIYLIDSRVSVRNPMYEWIE